MSVALDGEDEPRFVNINQTVVLDVCSCLSENDSKPYVNVDIVNKHGMQEIIGFSLIEAELLMKKLLKSMAALGHKKSEKVLSILSFEDE